jgi:outer membrane protein assembly factor BamB
MRRWIVRSALWLTAAILVSGAAAGQAGDWPQFRGPTQQGHSEERGLPLTWSETENIAWKTELPGLGWSSPAIVGRQIWLTTALDNGHSLRVLCVDRESGRLTHNIEVFSKANPGPIHKKNSHASPTPVVEGDRVYVHYGRHGTACLTTAGELVWKTELVYDHRHGPGGSPVLFEDVVIINCDGTDRQFTVGLDKRTGQEIWRSARDGRMAYSTPLLLTVNGQPQVVCCCGEWAVGYEPASGKEVWRFRYPGGYSNVPRPVAGFGLTFVSSGYDTPTFYALKLDQRGDITETGVAWKLSKGAPRNASPLLVGDELYLMTDNGIATCLDARTGEVHWQERVGGDFSASPVFADGRIYFLNETGKTTVLAPGKTYIVLAENELPGRTLASLAPAHGAIYLRTDTALYRIEEGR